MKAIDEKTIERTQTGYRLTIKRSYRAVYGLGEKFDRCNQKGLFVRACVREKCFYQGEYTYLSMPFFLTPDGFGVYVDTYTEVDFDFRKEGEITVEFPKGSRGEQAKVWLLEGTPKEILKEFRSLSGMPRVFPKWVLGAWMSSNRWNCQADVEEQRELTKKHGFPHSVFVIEPWSDLTTHSIWNGAKCTAPVGDPVHYTDLDFTGSVWYDPKKMTEELHADGLHLLLWIVPIFAQGANLESHCNVERTLEINKQAVADGDCVFNADGTPYEIPHTWCIGSMVPDFTKADATKRWFQHFEHLKEIGIDGFKTDGGEFIHVQSVKFSDGTTGLEGQNAYCEQYTKAFADFVGEEGIVFSRAGGQKTPSFSVVWAGDQESTWSEYASVVKAGISAGLSGISCWGYDIAGFSGYLPTAELYLRALQTAAFFPVMQWHSDPVSNNRCDFSGAWKINDRSPWNIAAFYKDEELLQRLRKEFYLHYNLIPYQYMLMRESAKSGTPALRHLVFEFPSDERGYSVDSEFMLGDALLIAPVLEDYISVQKVYLPEGKWFDFFTGKEVSAGEQELTVGERTPVFMRENSCVPLNLKGGKLFSDVGNDLDRYEELTFLVSGKGEYTFADDLGNEIELTWTKKDETVKKNAAGIAIRVVHIEKSSLL